MIVDAFISVVQRRRLSIEARLLPLLEPLFLVETHMSFEERLALLTLAAELPRGITACEVGSYLGASASFPDAAPLPGGHVHCVDTRLNEAMETEPAEDTFARFRTNTRPFRHFLTAYRGRGADETPRAERQRTVDPVQSSAARKGTCRQRSRLIDRP